MSAQDEEEVASIRERIQRMSLLLKSVEDKRASAALHALIEEAKTRLDQLGNGDG
jgi:predicted  nucleic acid-binding Zn-ribbon protein